MNKRWVRVVVSLFIGAGLQESLSIAKGKEVSGVLFITAIISYVIISATVYYRNIWLLQREVDDKRKKKDQLTDEFD